VQQTGFGCGLDSSFWVFFKFNGSGLQPDPQTRPINSNKTLGSLIPLLFSLYLSIRSFLQPLSPLFYSPPLFPPLSLLASLSISQSLSPPPMILSANPMLVLSVSSTTADPLSLLHLRRRRSSLLPLPSLSAGADPLRRHCSLLSPPSRSSSTGNLIFNFNLSLISSLDLGFQIFISKFK